MLAYCTSRDARLCCGLGAAFLLCGLSLQWNGVLRAEDPKTLAAGRALFTHEWIPRDARSPQGDGLGPVFNDTSCVGCHNQGGAGGAGPRAKNAQIVSAFNTGAPDAISSEPSFVSVLIELFGARRPLQAKPGDAASDEEVQQAKIQAERDRLAKIHPGFRTTRSVVLHRFSTEADYAAFRGKLTGLSQFGGFSMALGPGASGAKLKEPRPKLSSDESAELIRLQQEAQFGGAQIFGGSSTIDSFSFILSERNTPSLFGSGQIDAIPDAALLAAAERKFDDYPEVSGRVAKLKDGRIGRFGWKAQTARLGDFVLTACAVELGLHVPGQPQGGLPQKPEYQPVGLDLSQDECNSLIAFVASLPAPEQRVPAGEVEAKYLTGGRELFASAGCATCHAPQVGDVAGIYSDLLLHDMGQELGDAGSYGGFAPNSTEDEELKQPLPSLATLGETSKPVDETKLIGATRQEWRTPPLWGLRDSAPYLHDGRAATLEQAIAMHGGEGTRSAHKFFKLSPAERLQLTLFLRSLVAPD